MSERFEEGQEVVELWWPDDSCCTISHDNVDKITVVMEYGQMSFVPWFAIWKDGLITRKYNSVYISGVVIKK